jgi:hypothetical protein
MKTHDHWQNDSTDPLGLRQLGTIEPGYDGWDQVEAALRGHQAGKRTRPAVRAWLAVAAGLVMAVSVAFLISGPTPPDNRPAGVVATTSDNSASVTVQGNIDALIGLSQSMEEQVAGLRRETSAMPADTAIYVAELEDLIAQVDTGLSQTPDSIDLWGQRVNLLLDLAEIYQQQWQIDYGRIASL